MLIHKIKIDESFNSDYFRNYFAGFLPSIGKEALEYLHVFIPKYESFKNYLRLLEQYGALLARLQGIDARLDGKRKLIHLLAQSLYLTPRSRAGVVPPQKEEEEPSNDNFSKLYR